MRRIDVLDEISDSNGIEHFAVVPTMFDCMHPTVWTIYNKKSLFSLFSVQLNRLCAHSLCQSFAPHERALNPHTSIMWENVRTRACTERRETVSFCWMMIIAILAGVSSPSFRDSICVHFFLLHIHFLNRCLHKFVRSTLADCVWGLCSICRRVHFLAFYVAGAVETSSKISGSCSYTDVGWDRIGKNIYFLVDKSSSWRRHTDVLKQNEWNERKMPTKTPIQRIHNQLMRIRAEQKSELQSTNWYQALFNEFNWIIINFAFAVQQNIQLFLMLVKLNQKKRIKFCWCAKFFVSNRNIFINSIP